MREKNDLERQIVVFRLNSEEFGVNIDEVKEIIKLEEITKIPRTESYVDGVINIRGKIITVIDLAAKLKLQAGKATKDTRIIIINIDANEVGMVVDECSEVLRIPKDKISPVPEAIKSRINQNCLDGVISLNNRNIILLDLTKILDNN